MMITKAKQLESAMRRGEDANRTGERCILTRIYAESEKLLLYSVPVVFSMTTEKPATWSNNENTIMKGTRTVVSIRA